MNSHDTHSGGVQVAVSGSPAVVIAVVRIVVKSWCEIVHSHRFLIPSDPALTIGCGRGAKPSRGDVEDALYSPIGESDTSHEGGA
ncbi:hypothetical protein HNP02_004924 [Mycobacterium sp. AZCC_0083]|nr:hypothetical protein [Mycobacterium sp. AZCC_0083]